MRQFIEWIKGYDAPFIAIVILVYYGASMVTVACFVTAYAASEWPGITLIAITVLPALALWRMFATRQGGAQ